MTHDDSFFVRLPSNTITYSDNTLGSYRVRLPYQIHFEHADQWDVALYKADITHSWFNYESNENTPAVVVSMGLRIGQSDADIGYYTIKMQLDVPARYYSSPLDLVEALNEDIELKTPAVLEKYKKFALDLGKTPYHNDGLPTLQFSYNDTRKRVTITGPPQTSYKIKFNPVLAYILGFDKHNYGLARRYWSVETSNRVPHVEAEHPPDMRAGMYTLYVYCDVVEKQIVGDALVPLLDTVPVTVNEGDLIHYEPKLPMYIPVVKSSFATIEVDIKDDANRPIRFQYGKVLLVLHFKKRSLFL